MLSKIFRKNKPTKNDLGKELLKLGYIDENENEYIKRTNRMMTWVYFLEDKVKVKVYADAYSESEIIKQPFTKKEFITFIQQNEI